MGITVDSRPIESEVKDLLGSVVCAMMSLGRSIVATLENGNGFLAMYTPSDNLIRTYFEQKGVVPKVMLHIFEEFVLLLGRHSFNNEVSRMWHGGGVGGSGGSGVRWRVRESGVDDWIDRSEGNKFGFAGKSPPENFSGGGSVVAAVAAGWLGWPAVVG
nr:hypothetical protein [Tanacetum cinerariifolium]